MTVVLVRHAEPLTSSLEAPGSWPLSPSGRRAARLLRPSLPSCRTWVSSTERKAFDTLVHARHPGVVVTRDERFDEVRRDEPFDEGFRDRRLAWVEGRPDTRHITWESPADAAERFEAAVREHAAGDEHVVVGTHGMVLTAWLVHVRHRLTQVEAGVFWSRLSLPDVVRVD